MKIIDSPESAIGMTDAETRVHDFAECYPAFDQNGIVVAVISAYGRYPDSAQVIAGIAGNVVFDEARDGYYPA